MPSSANAIPASPTCPPELGVERGLVQDDRGLGADAGALDRLPADDDRPHFAFGDLGVVAQELGRAGFVSDREPHRFGRGLARPGPGLARVLALARHRPGEALDIDGTALGAERVLGEIERKAVGIVKLERDLARERRIGSEPAHFFVQEFEPAVQGLLEAGLLELQRFRDQRFGAHQFAERRPHQVD